MVHVSERVELVSGPKLYEATRSGQLAFLPPVIVGSLGALALVLPPKGGLFTVAAASILWGIWVVLTRGNRYLTPSGVFAVMVGVFLGAGSLYLGLLGSEVVSDDDLRLGAVIALLSTMGIDAVYLMRTIGRGLSWPKDVDGLRDREARNARERAFRPPSQFELKGMAIVVISKAPFIFALGPSISPALGLVGIMMICLGLSSIRQRIRWSGDAAVALLAFAVPAWWVSTVFTGYGRLRLAGIALAVLAAWNLVRPSRLHKVAILLALPGMLLYMGESRRELQNKDIGRVRQEAGVGVGLESVYSPVETFAWVTTEHDFPSGGSIGPRYGGTFVNTVLLPVPRRWWPGKPKGFGAELTELLKPQYVPYGVSLAALAQGEWYANFGWLGLLAMAVALGWFLAWCDRRHARIAASGFSDPRTWHSTVTLLCIMSSLGELYWMGTFSFFDRGGLAAVFAAIIAVVSVRRQRRPSLEPDWIQGQARAPISGSAV